MEVDHLNQEVLHLNQEADHLNQEVDHPNQKYFTQTRKSRTSKSRNTSDVIDGFILDKINQYCSDLDRHRNKTHLIGRFIINR